MRRLLHVSRLKALLATTLVLGVALVTVAPHHHNHAAGSSQTESCQVCRLEAAHTGTPAVIASPPQVMAAPAGVLLLQHTAPRIICSVHRVSSRAPPVAV